MGEYHCDNFIAKQKRLPRHKLITNIWFASKVKELPPELPWIFGNRPVEVSDAVEIWIDRAHIDHFSFVKKLGHNSQRRSHTQ